MGYDLRITRGVVVDEVPPADPIRSEEWSAVVEIASDLTWDSEGTDAVLVGHPARPPLRLEDGMVVITNPPEAILPRLVELAEQLDAVVVGDDAEVYRRQPDGGFLGADPLDRYAAGQLPEWWRRLDPSRRAGQRPLPVGAPEPVVGERYLDLITRKPCSVREIDAEAERGRGLVRVMFDDQSEAWRLRCDGDLGTLDEATDGQHSSWSRFWRRGAN